MFKLSRFTLPAVLVLGSLAIAAGAGTSQAVTVATGGVSVLPKLARSESLIEPARHRRHFRTHRYRHHHRGFWYAVPFWLYTTPAPSYRYSDSHVQWCLHRYRSYNVRSDLYLGYDGRYHRCRSPYRP